MWPGRAKRASGRITAAECSTRQVMRDDDCPIGMFPVVTLRSSRTKRSGQVANGNCSEDKHSRASLTSSARETYEAKATPGKDDRGV